MTKEILQPRFNPNPALRIPLNRGNKLFSRFSVMVPLTKWCALHIIILFLSSCNIGINAEKCNITVPLFPDGKDGAVSLVYITHNATDDFSYNHVYCPLKKTGFVGTFYINLELVTNFQEKDISHSFWSRLREYSENGNEIGLYIRTHITNDSDANQILELTKKGADIIYNKIKTRPKTLYMDSPLGSHELSIDLELEKAGFFVNTFSNYRMRAGNSSDSWQCPEPEEPGEFAEKNHLWVQFKMGTESFSPSEGIDKYNQKLFEDLHNRNIAVTTVSEMEYRKRDLVNLRFKPVQTGWKVQGVSSPRGLESNIIQNDDSATIKLLNNSTLISYNEIDRPIRICYFPNNANALVVFSVDDLNEEMFKIWYPTFKDAGIKATFFLCCRDNAFLKKNSSEFLKMQDDGFEIGCHSASHSVDNKSIGHFPNLFPNDLQEGVKTMKKYGFKGEAYCFPGNYHTKETRDATSAEFRFMVANERSPMNPAKTKFTAEILSQYILNRNDYHVFMLHTPIYDGADWVQAFKPFLNVVSEDKHFANMTYSQSRAYFEELFCVYPILIPEKNAIKIFLKSNSTLNFTQVPLTIAVSLKPEETRKEYILTVNGKQASYIIDNESSSLLFNALPNSEILIQEK